MKKPEVMSGVRSQSLPRKSKMSREEAKKKLQNARDRDSELVTGLFQNLENPAQAGSKGALVFSICLYPGDPTTVYELWDGERYQLPRGVARHLNNNCFYKEYQHLDGQFGEQGMRGAISDGLLKNQTFQMAKKVHRFAFRSMDYMDDDIEMNTSNLVEVTVSP